jgi:hypothetical protein
MLPQTAWHDGGRSRWISSNAFICICLQSVRCNLASQNLENAGVFRILFTLRASSVFTKCSPQAVCSDTETSIPRISGRRDSPYFPGFFCRHLTGSRLWTRHVAHFMDVRIRPSSGPAKKGHANPPPYGFSVRVGGLLFRICALGNWLSVRHFASSRRKQGSGASISTSPVRLGGARGWNQIRFPLHLGRQLPSLRGSRLVMAFTESVLAYTTRIEKLLVDLGGKSNGMIEKAKSLPNLPGPLLVDLRKIASVRNRLVHDHDYRFAGKEELFFGLCERAVANLTSLLPRTESLPRNAALDHQGAILSAATSATRPPSVDEAFRREIVGNVRRREGGGPKESAPPGSASVGQTKPSDAKVTPVSPNRPADVTSIILVPWAVAIAIAIICWKLLPHLFVRTVETGWWFFKSSHQEIAWEVFVFLSIAVGLVGFFLTRGWLGKRR